jgi:drug/metabolite transporter (DMT)-like permease
MAVLGVAITVLMWSTLATSVDLLHAIPALFVNGVALTIGGLIGLPWARNWKLPLSLLLLGAGLMFVYHVIYFYALQLGDPIGVSLLHYLWPILIVCLTGFMSSAEKKSRAMFLSALLGFGGAAAACWSVQQPLLVSSPSISISRHVLREVCAYGLALLSAFAWAGYSVLGKRYRTISSHSVGAFSLPAGLACLALHFCTGHWPTLSRQDWLVLVYMGLGPMGLAFYLWDFGMKRGRTSITTALSYATPVLSTIFLPLAAARTLPATLWVGVAMVTISVAVAGTGRKQKLIQGNLTKPQQTSTKSNHDSPFTIAQTKGVRRPTKANVRSQTTPSVLPTRVASDIQPHPLQNHQSSGIFLLLIDCPRCKARLVWSLTGPILGDYMRRMNTTMAVLAAVGFITTADAQMVVTIGHSAPSRVRRRPMAKTTKTALVSPSMNSIKAVSRSLAKR